MRVQIMSMISLLLLIAVSRAEQKCIDDETIVFVPFCDLVREPQNFDGRVVRTEAVWQRMIHSEALADRICSASGSELLLVLPSISRDSSFNNSLRKKLGKLLGKDGAARVRVTGVFRQNNGRAYTMDGQIFQLEIECLLAVTALRSDELKP